MAKKTRDREGGKSGIYRIKLPVSVTQTSKVKGLTEKTSLYVPRKELFWKAGFAPSEEISDQVLITRNMAGIMEAIFKYGDVAARYGQNGLENDPSRQQIIVYSAVACRDYVLWYQRAGSSVRTTDATKINEARLEGKYSLGFGGHKTSRDIQFGREELVFLQELLPAIRDDIGTVLGMNKGFFSEVEEELGLRRSEVKNVTLLGAFHDMRFEDPTVEIQVGWVHTGIATLLEVDEKQVGELTLSATEIARAWWVPKKKLLAEFEEKQKLWLSGKGPKVESWSEIMIKEFLD